MDHRPGRQQAGGMGDTVDIRRRDPGMQHEIDEGVSVLGVGRIGTTISLPGANGQQPGLHDLVCILWVIDDADARLCGEGFGCGGVGMNPTRCRRSRPHPAPAPCRLRRSRKSGSGAGRRAYGRSWWRKRSAASPESSGARFGDRVVCHRDERRAQGGNASPRPQAPYCVVRPKAAQRQTRRRSVTQPRPSQ